MNYLFVIDPAVTKFLLTVVTRSAIKPIIPYSGKFLHGAKVHSFLQIDQQQRNKILIGVEIMM